MVGMSSHSQLSRHLPSSLIPKVLKMFMECFESSPVDNETGSADPLEQMDNTRTALRMALGARMDKFVNPGKKEEYIELVWHDKVGSELNLLDVDWLMDCAKHFHTVWQDFDATGDALLLLTDFKNISQDSIVPFLNSSPRSTRLRHCALRAACRAVDINSTCDPSFAKAVLMAVSPSIQRSPLIDIQRLVFVVLLDCKRTAVHIAYRIRQDLAMITGTPSLTVPVPLQTDVLSKLSPALFTMVSIRIRFPRLFFYLRLIFALASQKIGHIKRCIIIPVFCDQPPSSFFYLPESSSASKASGGDDMVFAGRRDRNDGSDSDVLDDGIDILEALVTTLTSDLEFLRNGLGGAILKLESRTTTAQGHHAQIKI
ncbi:hypothetical protein BDR07DRAFT_1425797 [Suillus spraguei]|nr:hypothetical protein BDR07DRAFT_1425797 [Suillus spraguei]